MKKVGTITESRMTKPSEPKSYPLVSDSLFGGKVKIEENAKKGYPKKGIKGGTKAAAKVAKATKVGKATLLKDADKVLTVGDTRTSSQKSANMSDYASQRGNTENPGNEKVYNSMTDAKDPDWIQQMVKRKTALKKEVAENPAAYAEKIKKQAGEWRKKNPLRPTGDDGRGGKPSPHSTQPLQTDAFEPSAEPDAKPRGTAKPVRKATAAAEAGRQISKKQKGMVAGNEKAEMGARMKAAEEM